MNNYETFFHHLHPIELKDKDLFLWSTKEIEQSFSGRIDILESGLQRFFMESAILLRNAIHLYEQGVFDAAFYSARTALELARIVTHFSNEDRPIESSLYREWRRGGWFPHDSKIKERLNKSASAYAEIRDALEDFFIQQDGQLKQAQKYIHKQGFISFYERALEEAEREQLRSELIAKQFHNFVKGTLTHIAFLRLCIDPFPVLLRDPHVMYKVHSQPLTEAFSDVFVEEILGQENLNRFCSTGYYRSYVEFFADNEEMTEEVRNLVYYQIYDRKNSACLLRQAHLLSDRDLMAVRLFELSSDFSTIYMFDGLKQYYSDSKSNRSETSFSSLDLRKVREGVQINSSYGAAYLSYFDFNGDGFWIEHNSVLGGDMISRIESLLGTLSSDESIL